MKLHPMRTELFRADRQTNRQEDRHDETDFVLC